MTDSETQHSSENGPAEPWERDLLEKVTLASIVEHRRARRWGIFFKLLTFLYLALVLVLWWPDNLPEATVGKDKHTALVEIKGVISSETKASADNIITGLRDAFEDDDTKGVILRINSPGGSPVQAGYVNDEIRRLKKAHPDIPVYAVLVDICASGGYYIAAAADEIYADKASIVGSIGVLMNGFGFVGAMKELGVERRLLTAGRHKGIMDPFSPMKEADREHVQRILDQLHRQFIEVVREGRGERLKGKDAELFSGLFWSGEKGVDLGLVDGLGSSSYVARELIGAEDIVDFTHKEDLWTRLADRIGTTTASTFARIMGLGGMPAVE